MGGCLKVGTKAVFQNHTYKYGPTLFKHVKGGPTGLWITGVGAYVRMTRWGRKVLEILEKAGVDVDFVFLYVDDVRVGLRDFVEGLVYCKECEAFTVTESQRQIDLTSGESHGARTAWILGELMNSLEPDIKFTTETVDDFLSDTLPTLDYQLWVEPVLPEPVPLTSTLPAQGEVPQVPQELPEHPGNPEHPQHPLRNLENTLKVLTTSHHLSTKLSISFLKSQLPQTSAHWKQAPHPGSNRGPPSVKRWSEDYTTRPET